MRTCGQCHECCTQIEVVPLGKPAGVVCPHHKPSACGACGIYAERPTACRQFTCAWLDGLTTEELKPETTGIVLETARIEWPKQIAMLAGFEPYPGAVAKHHDAIVRTAVNGVVVMIVLKTGQPAFYGESEDLAAVETFMDNARREGGIVHHYADDVVRVEL